MTDKQPEALRMARKPCEYCGHDLPEGVDKKTRRIRTYHFQSCVKRPRWEPDNSCEMLIAAAPDLLSALQEAENVLRRIGAETTADICRNAIAKATVENNA